MSGYQCFHCGVQIEYYVPISNGEEEENEDIQG